MDEPGPAILSIFTMLTMMFFWIYIVLMILTKRKRIEYTEDNHQATKSILEIQV